MASHELDIGQRAWRVLRSSPRREPRQRRHDGVPRPALADDLHFLVVWAREDSQGERVVVAREADQPYVIDLLAQGEYPEQRQWSVR